MTEDGVTPQKRQYGGDAHLQLQTTAKKRKLGFKGRGGKRKSTAVVKEGSSEEILLKDLANLSLSHPEPGEAATNEEDLPETFTEIDVEITELGSNGDGLGYQTSAGGATPTKTRIYVVPFTLPGDTVRARVVKHFHAPHRYTLADFVRILTPSSTHERIEPRCQYFTRCSGCAFQQLPYAAQLAFKQSVVAKAYRNFSGLDPALVPDVEPTQASPLEYGYRTKLTPHFDKPKGLGVVPPIGYMMKGRRTTLDIEECPIGTAVVEEGVRRERVRAIGMMGGYKKGATLLVRETTERTAVAKHDPESAAGEGQDQGFEESKRYLTSSSELATEYVDGFRFDFPAGSFFQNNNSILPAVISHLKSHLKPHLSASNDRNPSSASTLQPTSLIDAYCGTGLFSLTLAPLPFAHVLGLDVSSQSIRSARQNLALNAHLLPKGCDVQFREADAATIFQTAKDISAGVGGVNSGEDGEGQSFAEGMTEEGLEQNGKCGRPFEPNRTVVVIDPPRKGCDENFLRQLLEFGPQKVVYVSCNVHTQARDVGWLLKQGIKEQGEEEEEAVEGGGVGAGVKEVAVSAVNGESDGEETGEVPRYRIESIRGFDFFPQTSQVESVAILSRI